MRISCLALIVLALLMPSAFAARVALVIGNGTYKVSPLKNPANDARDMSAKLKELGFTVIAKENLKRKEITPTLRQFRNLIKPGDEVMFFYAGHGLQVKGTNYLPAVDAEIDSEDDVPMESINVSGVLELLDESKAAVKLVFLDACRNNPYARSFRSADRGLSRVGNVAPSGTLISFATRPGDVAADGNGKNGLYTEQLLKYMSRAGLPIEQVIKEVTRDVIAASANKQTPWSEGSLLGDFYFRKGMQVASLSPAFVASPSSLPGAVDVDFSDLKKAQQEESTAREQWAAWQKRMQAAFDTAAQFSGAIAVAAWDRFAQSYASDNPYSGDDEKLRAAAAQRKVEAQAQITSRAPVDTIVTNAGGLIAGRYLPLGDGSEIKDQHTGLIWQRCAVGMRWDSGTCTGEFERKFTFAKAQVLSRDGWRVPSKDELATIVDKSRKAPAINMDAFPATPSLWFWSSTSDSGHSSYAWYADFYSGSVSSSGNSNWGAVRLARADQQAQNLTQPKAITAPLTNQLIAGRYLPLGDGSEIKDQQTGLIWQRCAVGVSWDGRACTGEPRKVIFENAKKLTGNGWRIPDKDELEGIVDKTRSQPAINTDVFPDTPSTSFWSSSAYVGSSSSVWYIGFYNGNVGNVSPKGELAVRLVRASQQAQNLTQPQATTAPITEQLIAGRYLPLGDGSEIKDQQTGSIWKRCVEGMTWNGITCTGKFSTFSFGSANALENKEANTSGKKWRLATKDELAFLIDKSQNTAKIHPQAFPASPRERYWTSSAGTILSGPWIVNFGNGEIGYGGFHFNRYPIRLVRTGQ